MDKLNDRWRLSWGLVYSAHHGLLMHCNMPRFYQNLFTKGDRPGHCSFEAVGGIAMEGGSYRRDRYMVVVDTNNPRRINLLGLLVPSS